MTQSSNSQTRQTKNLITIVEKLLSEQLQSSIQKNSKYLASTAKQEIRKRNNIWYLGKWEIYFSFAYLSAVWLLFGQNPIEIILDKIFKPNFAKIVTKQLINK